MAKPQAPREPTTLSDKTTSPATKSTDDRIKQESSAQYRRSIEKINQSQDRDIARALRQ